MFLTNCAVNPSNDCSSFLVKRGIICCTIMSFFGWGSSKQSKPEVVPLSEITWLHKSLQQVLKIVGLLECNSEALKAAVESQTYMIQNLQQELQSCNLKNALTDKWTQTEQTSKADDTGCSGDGCSLDRFSEVSSDEHHENNESAVDPPSKQKDIIVKYLLNSQTVLMNQAIAIHKAVLNSIQWLENLQQEMDSWFSQKFEPSLNEQDKKYQALEDEKNRQSKRSSDLEEETNRLSGKCKKLEEEKSLSSENYYAKNPAMHSSSSGRNWHFFYNPVPRKKQVTTLVYFPKKSDLMTSVVSELRNALQLQMSTYNLELNMQICETPSQIQGALPVIVLCLQASRLGTDVSNALQGVKAGPNIAVLILHHKDIHALPTQSSDRILTGSEYKNVGVIIDMACLTSKGIYPCDMNNRALETLLEFIKRHSQP